MAIEVLFHPLAEKDLVALYDHIAEDSPANAIAFVRRLRDQCMRLSFFPLRGRDRDDLPAGVRAVAFERRTLIAYRRDATGWSFSAFSTADATWKQHSSGRPRPPRRSSSR